MLVLNILKNDLNDLPLRVVSGDELLFVVDDLLRLTGVDGWAKKLLTTFLNLRFKIDHRLRVRKYRLPPLEGYEERRSKKFLVDKVGAYYILSMCVVNPIFTGHGYEYEEYINQISVWFKSQFELDEYEEYRYKQLCDSLLIPVDDKIGTDYINFVW